MKLISKEVHDLIDKNKNNKLMTELGKIVDKNIPSIVLEGFLPMLNKQEPANLLSLLTINSLFKKHMLFELSLVEDYFTTGIYKTKYASTKLIDFIEMEVFPYADKNLKKSKFIEFLVMESKKRREDFFDFIKESSVFELFESLTLGGKIICLSYLDRDFTKDVFTSNRTKFTKKDIILFLEYSKKIRNHLAHSYFVLDEKPYLKMFSTNESLDDSEIISQLFEKVDNILKISSRNNILKRVKASIKKEIQSNTSKKSGISFLHFNSVLLK